MQHYTSKALFFGVLYVLGLSPCAWADCVTPSNAIEAENCLAGAPPGQWDITGYGDLSLQGFATDISYNLGATVQFKINTTASAYTIDIYRLGYYAGLGARHMASVTPSATLPQSQPACIATAGTGLGGSGLTDCGNWAVSASWAIPADAVSGVYVVLLRRPDTGGKSHIIFVVRNDAGHSALLLQTSDIDWQAYNYYGGGSLYGPSSGGFALGSRSYKVSYNRPLLSRAAPMSNSVFVAEYPLIRWLEANAYDVSYFSGIDTDRFGSLIAQHSAFLSSGHDEYWTGHQRANVETARNSGVHLGFFTGNEMFWKVRLENSADGSNTPNRTLVCYKETAAGAVIDPQDPPTWTGTWRDPRFSPPGDGGRPENALTGTLYMVNGPENPPLSIKITAEDGKLRLWRNTAAAAQTAGQVMSLPAGSLGYEWDIDADNGFRPAGLIPLSTATYNITNDYLLDYGVTYGSGVATHRMTLYRAPSGALVFGAGTIQWNWGLDAVHDAPFYAAFAADVRMQQATVNLLADMGVQPGALQPGLTPASPSLDTTPPSSLILAPGAGSTVSVGTPVTVSGTASDAGGLVGGVEVSTDGGATWHPATGRAAWSYNWIPAVTGAAAIKSRAVDDSGNLETPAAGVNVSVQARICPCTVFSTNPATADSLDPNAVELGVKFRADVNGFVTGVRFYKSAANSGTHVGRLWTRDGVLLSSVTFTGETASGWQQANFPTAVAISAGVTYVVSYFAPHGHYAVDDLLLAAAGVDNPPLHALEDGIDGGNAVFTYGAFGGFPVSTYRSRSYGVDLVFQSTLGGASGPTVTAVSPVSGASGIGLTAPVTAVFNKALAPATISTSTFQLLDASLNPVPVNVTWNAATLTVTMSPPFGLDYGTTYTALIAGGAGGVQDTSGNTMSASISWKFSSVPTPPGSCPCTAWPSTAVPQVADSGDGSALELGVRLRSDVGGFITGLRFYKSPANTGAHVAHLWSKDGALLATGTFTGETVSGWQQASFPSAVAIAANTTYVASYSAPAGHYPVDDLYFAATALNAPPLHLLQDGVDGGNGGYGALGTFPSATFRSRNYWVDVVFVTNVGGVFGPNVTSVTPASGATGLGPAPLISAVFNKALNAASITSATFRLLDAAGNQLPGSLTYNAATLTVTLTPSAALAPAASYTVAIAGGTGGVQDSSGNPLRYGVTWRFSTCCAIWTSSALPATIDSADGGAVELGMKFRSDVNGFITGVRFYKSAANTGTHTGRLWTRDGILLASAPFSGETASGWQQVNFPNAIAVTAGTTYVASYAAPNGHYSVDDLYFSAAGVDNPPLHALKDGVDGGNAVFGAPGAFPVSSFRSRNYWVDAVFAATVGGVSGPSITSISPASAATGVAPTASITVTFTKAMDASSITASSFQLLDGSLSAVAGTITYNAPTLTATLVPVFGLSYGATYTVVVAGGATGVRDTSGNGMTAGVSWVFATSPAPPGSCPCTIWSPAATPRTIDSGDGSALELGVRFHSDVSGFITNVRFYKSAANTGPHTAHLWTADGTLLASAAFVNESTSGWQQAAFPSAIAIAANTDYIASYSAPNGRYSVDDSYFAAAAVDNPPLHASADTAAKPNGLFVYGAGGSFPNSGYNARNYWVDVVLLTSSGGVLGPTVTSLSPGSGASGVSVASQVSAIFNRALTPSTVSGATVKLADASNNAVAATVTYNAATFAATLAPTAPLALATSYTASLSGGLSGIRDSSGNPMQYSVSWVFTTELPPPGSCPCSAWAANTVPGHADSGDPGAVGLGAKFRTDVNGYVTAVRFYKSSANTGAHIGYLWAADGTLLASAAFTGETPSGWQQMNFSSPVAIAAATTYIVSYYAPNGHYSVDLGYFAAAGVDNGPLHLLKDGADGGSGVYIYGASGAFPVNTYSSSNYWVDVVFKTTL